MYPGSEISGEYRHYGKGVHESGFAIKSRRRFLRKDS